MNFYKKFIAYILAIALLTLSLAGCSGKGSDDAGSNGPQQGSGGKTPPAFEMENYSLTPAENYDELARLLAGVINGDAYSSAENVGVVDEFFASGDRPSYAGNYGEQSNDTRQLPEGVSQADAAVLANGYLYQVQDGELTILQAQGADTAVVSSTGVTADPAGYDNYEETAQAVAVSGDLAAVMTYVYAWNTVAGENGEWSSETVSQTHVKLYDVQDKAAPVAVADFVQDGSYRAAYLANDTLYLLTDDYVINLDEQDSASFIPTCGAAGQTAQLPAEKILVNDQVDAPVYTVLSAISMQNGAATDTLAVTGQMQPCFAAADKIYLAGWCYAMQQSEQYKENQYQVTDYYSHAITLIASLHCTDGLRLEKTACVNGRLPEASSLDYDGGYLRLGTMAESYTNRLFEDDSMGFSNLEPGKHSFSNEVHILDGTLQEVGRLTGLSDSSLIYYQRLLGTLGYTVSYDKAEGVYTLDLSDPTAPAMGKALSGSDPAEILLRYGDRFLGLTAGGKLQLLEQDGATLKTVAEANYGQNYLNIRYHLNSVLVSPEDGVIALPGDGTLLLFRVADDAITEIGEVAVSVTDATRVLRAGDLLYVTSPGGCTVVQASDGQSVGQADIAVG